VCLRNIGNSSAQSMGQLFSGTVHIFPFVALHNKSQARIRVDQTPRDSGMFSALCARSQAQLADFVVSVGRLPA